MADILHLYLGSRGTNTKEEASFMALVRKQLQQQQGRVGNTYGERRNNDSFPTTQRPQASKPLDKFAGIANNANTKNKTGLAGFAANATFQAARRFSSGAPYKRPLHDHIEKGTAPARGHKQPPSDNAILNFLDRVIERTPANPRIARNMAAKQRTAPARTPAQATMQEVVKTARPRTRKA
ncbi:MAG: hypothetical protein ABH871_01720 [Pseudomonadota bacterium]